tara:strand:+ start:169 stop:336 length:168 start_codon:yes stop_codon:yes gene_type:complete
MDPAGRSRNKASAIEENNRQDAKRNKKIFQIIFLNHEDTKTQRDSGIMKIIKKTC